MLPYTTAIDVAKICKEIIKESGSKSESKNKYPVLNYTLDEIKQYAYLPTEELPEDFVLDVDSITLPVSEACHTTYVEFQTKDNYTFKGVLTVVGDISFEACIQFSDIVCYDGNNITKIIYKTEHDAETGDVRVLLYTIEVI